MWAFNQVDDEQITQESQKVVSSTSFDRV
jgi:hypothetical protein